MKALGAGLPTSPKAPTEGLPLYIDDDTDTSLSNIRSKARCHQMRHGLDLLVIDYLTLIAVTERLAGENQTQRIRSRIQARRASE